jgi:HEAT repeat protein
VSAGVDALNRDGWWFVKVQAVALLLNAPAGREADDALGAALHDTSIPVRGASIVALAKRRATAWRATIRERLDDKGEDNEVRAASARALGALCDSDSADRLTELARHLADPIADEEAQQLGIAAVGGLAALQPADLKARLGPLLEGGSPGYARAAAQEALAARRMCK